MKATLKDIAEFLLPFLGIALVAGICSVGCHAVGYVNAHLDAAAPTTTCTCPPAPTPPVATPTP